MCLMGVMLVLVGARIGYTGLFWNSGLEGLSVPNGAVFETTEFGDRLDFDGDMGDVDNVMRQLRAIEVRRENLDDGLVIIYAVSNRLNDRTQERWGEFNVMIAVRGDRIAVGYPVLNGSF